MIFLYGPPGAGKSTVGKALAAALDMPFWDADDEIETQVGMDIPAIFAGEGETGFRQRETAVIGNLLTQQEGVLALGGGALLDEALRLRVEAAGPVLCLQAPLEVLRARLDAAAAERPLLATNLQERLPQLLAQRAAHYASFAHQLDAAGEPAAIAWAAQIALGRFHVTGMGPGYDVLVQPGGLTRLGDMLQARHMAGPIALVSDENVLAHWGETAVTSLEAAGYTVHPVVMPPGEVHKTPATISHFWDAFLAAGLERGSTVLAFGGGVVGDLAGFAAATFLRGVQWVAVPTSLLAMVDASIGGKTGADLPQGKNLVGAFYPPRLVLADPQVLATLPPAELRSGLGEVVKHGIIGDPALFALCARGETAVSKDWDQLVRRAMAVKIGIIQADPYEGGRRAALNLGHTIGHAVELVSGFNLRHGEAIAIGTVVEAMLAERLGLADAGLAATIAKVLAGLGLPAEIPEGLDRAAIAQAVGVDKKRKGGQVKFALPVQVGEVITGVHVPNWPDFLKLRLAGSSKE